MNGQNMIWTTVAVASGSALGADYYEGKPVSGKIILGGFGLGLVLSLANLASERVTVALSWVIILSSLLVNGGRILNARGK